MKIAEKIYRLRTESDMTQVQFGQIAGASDKAVSTWERGEKEPRLKSLQQICAHFDIDINLFADESTDVYSKKQSTLNAESELLGPAKLALLDAIKDVDDASAQTILDIVKSVKKLRGE